MKVNDVTTCEVDGPVAVITLNAPPVNALSAVVRQGIAGSLKAALEDDDVRAIVLICEGRTFFAGADITEFGKPPVEPVLRNLQLMLENATKPIVAAIHGTALGGGLELALVAHYRIAAPSAKCGLPEVNLGLLPGAGGTQRLPRIVGIPKALDFITSGAPVSASTAKDMGLIDKLAQEGNLRADAIAFARRVIDEKRPLLKIRDRTRKLDEARGKPEIFAHFRKANARKFRGYKAPESIIRCIEATLDKPFDEGLAFEATLFRELQAGSQSAAQRHIFFAERQAARIDDIPADTPCLPIRKVGVIGAGTMGGGIAMSFANAGIPVTLVDTGEDALFGGLRIIRDHYEATAKKGRMKPEDVDGRMGLLTGSVTMEDLSDCDLVIEAVFELMDTKKKVFAKLDRIAKPDAILATNTSYLDIDEIAAATNRPESVIGLHFFSPAHIMKLLEIVRSKHTRADIIATSMKLARTLGKVGVLVGNGYGFVGNRILAARSTQADRLILEGATPERVDKILYDFGFPMGHFQMRDLAGLDVGWNREKSNSSTVREILNEMGRHGQKTQGGFYDYDKDRNRAPSPAVMKVIEDFAAKHGVIRREVSDAEIRDRLFYAMVNEGAKLLDEGIASRASDIDVIWVMGYGWPKYEGGPMFWADLQGLPQLFEKLKSLQATHGDAFAPSPLIERLISEGKGFKDA